MIQKAYIEESKKGQWITVRDHCPTRTVPKNLMRTIRTMLDKCMTDELGKQEIERLNEELTCMEEGED